MAVKTVQYNNQIFEICYTILNHESQNDIIFLHGWGSNKEVMSSCFKDSFKDFRHIYIDMPGFGNSKSEAVLKTIDYKNIIELFLNQISAKKDFLVGHSFGGKVGTLLNPKNLILLSSAGIQKRKSLKVRFKIKLFKLLKPLKFGNLYKFFATKDVENMPKNMYETLKNVVDEDFSDIFQTFSNKAFIFWGESDFITPISSGEKIHSLIKNSQFFILNGDHYFFLKHAKEIEQKVLNGLL